MRKKYEIYKNATSSNIYHLNYGIKWCCKFYVTGFQIGDKKYGEI